MSAYTLNQRVTALETLVNVLIAALAESGSLSQDTYLWHLCRATNELEASGLISPKVLSLLDAVRMQRRDLFPEV
jgi:hypothetical protein